MNENDTIQMRTVDGRELPVLAPGTRREFKLSQAHQARRAVGLGSSDIAAIAGIDPHRSALDVFLRLTMPQGEEHQVETGPMRWGLRLEAAIADEFEESTGMKLVIPSTFGGADAPWAFCTPDRYILNDQGLISEVLEIKTADKFTREKWGEEDSDVPDHYYLQVQWQLFRTKLPVERLSVLIGGNDRRFYTIEPNHNIQSNLFKIASRFMENVKAGIPPKVGGSEHETAALLRMFPMHREGAQIPMTSELFDLAAEYASAREESKLAEERKSKAANQIRQAIGTAEGSSSDGVKISWKSGAPRSVVDWEAIVKEMNPSVSLIEKHTEKRPPIRTLRVTLK